MVKGRTFADTYEQLIKKVVNEGQLVSPRNQNTKELLQETFMIECPASNLVYCEGRNFSVMHAIVESLYIFSEKNNKKITSIFNPKMKEFSDDGITLYGDYGSRIAESIQSVITKLRSDPDTRQAVVTIYDTRDLTVSSKDIPCTVALQFTIRNCELNMHVYMRSNDLVWGTPYDVFMFTNMQMVIANELGIVCGNYYHTATSMHVYYERDKEIINSLLNNKMHGVTKYNPNSYPEWKKLAEELCSLALAKPDMNYYLRTEKFAFESSYRDAIYAEWFYRYGDDRDVPAFSYILDKIDTNRKAEWLKPFTKRWRGKNASS